MMPSSFGAASWLFQARKGGPPAGRRASAWGLRLRLGRWALALLVLAATAGPARAQPGEASEDAFFDAAYSPAYEDTMVARINAQIHRYFDRYTRRVTSQRDQHWDRERASWEAYTASVEPQRERLRQITGVVDERADAKMEYVSVENPGALVAETDRYAVYQVRWPVLEGIEGEGLLLRPAGAAKAHVVAYPDADQTPAQIAGLAEGVEPSSQVARRLAESGVEVLVPLLINRATTFSGGQVIPRLPWLDENEERLDIRTNQAHREWLYKQAYPNGRHLIGFEVQKGLAAIDWFEQQGAEQIGVAGYGEGGLLAFYAAAVDERIDAALVSGYFGPRDELWREPVYRHVWGLLTQFGDAEIASLVTPRALVVEYSAVPDVEAPPPLEPYVENEEWFRRIARTAGTPGRLTTPSLEAVRSEVDQVRAFFAGSRLEPSVQLVSGGGAAVAPGSEAALQAFAAGLSIEALGAPGDPPGGWTHPDPQGRMKRQITQISQHLMRRVANADFTRYQFLDGDRSSPAAWEQSMEPYRTYFYEEIIGKLPAADRQLDPHVQRRKVFDREHWTGHEVIMDVLPGVHGWGLLAVPKGLDEGERRPLVVVQHGQLGTPSTPLRVDSYHHVMARLAERGFVVFAPYNSYEFEVRRAMPLKASVYSVLIPQYRQMVGWLKTLDYVDADRIAYYGKSWGGRTALYIPPFIKAFKAVISSAYFNKALRKTTTPHYALSYLFHGSAGSLSVYQFDQGNTFGHAELAMLIAPRPFMVENGYYDSVAPDEWAGYEFAKVKRLYQLLGVGDRAVFGTHIGGHEVHAGTIFPFLHKHLHWPVPPTGTHSSH